MDATERALREQAMMHGLSHFAPEAPHMPDDVEASIREEAERDEADLHQIAGLRDGASQPVFEIGARWGSSFPAPPPEPEPEPEGLDLQTFESAEALAELGLDALRDELGRLGAKAGGSLAERAARLWRCRGLAPGAPLPPDVVAKKRRIKPKKRADDDDAEERAPRGPAAPVKPKKRRRQQKRNDGPLIATARFSRKEQSILDFCGGVGGGR